MLGEVLSPLFCRRELKEPLKEPEKLLPHIGRGRSIEPVGEFGRLILGASRSGLLRSAKAEPRGVWAIPSGLRCLLGLAPFKPRPAAMAEAERLVEAFGGIGAGDVGSATGGGGSAAAPLAWGSKLGLLLLLLVAWTSSGWGGLDGGV